MHLSPVARRGLQARQPDFSPLWCVKIGLSPGGAQTVIWHGRNCFIRQVGLQSQSDWLAPSTLLSIQVLCVKHVPYQAMTCSPCEQLGGRRASALSIPEHLRCWLVQRGGLWGYMAAASPELQLWQKVIFRVGDRVRDAVESDFCNAVPMVISWNWALLCSSLASVLCRLTVQVIPKAELIAAVLNWK